jgi:hypothetical protein
MVVVRLGEARVHVFGFQRNLAPGWMPCAVLRDYTGAPLTSASSAVGEFPRGGAMLY